MQSGDRFVVTTDGVVDQVGQAPGRPPMAFGFRRLMQFLESHREHDAQAMMTALGAEVQRWQGDGLRRDDVTAVCLRI